MIVAVISARPRRGRDTYAVCHVTPQLVASVCLPTEKHHRQHHRHTVGVGQATAYPDFRILVYPIDEQQRTGGEQIPAAYLVEGAYNIILKCSF